MENQIFSCMLGEKKGKEKEGESRRKGEENNERSVPYSVLRAFNFSSILYLIIQEPRSIHILKRLKRIVHMLCVMSNMECVAISSGVKRKDRRLFISYNLQSMCMV